MQANSMVTVMRQFIGMQYAMTGLIVLWLASAPRNANAVTVPAASGAAVSRLDPVKDPSTDPNTLQSIEGRPYPGADRERALGACANAIMPVNSADDLARHQVDFGADTEARIKKCMNDKGYIYGAEAPHGKDGAPLQAGFPVDNGTALVQLSQNPPPLGSTAAIPGGVLPPAAAAAAAAQQSGGPAVTAQQGWGNVPSNGSSPAGTPPVPAQAVPPSASVSHRAAPVFVSPDDSSTSPAPIFLNR